MFTRYPVYGEDMDDIIGVFHSKYLLQWSVDPERPLMDFCDSDPLTVHEFQWLISFPDADICSRKGRRIIIMIAGV